MAIELNNDSTAGLDGPQFSAEVECGPDVAPWTEIDPGRFMPRRVRGSFQGRALG